MAPNDVVCQVVLAITHLLSILMSVPNRFAFLALSLLAATSCECGSVLELAFRWRSFPPKQARKWA